MKTTASDDTLLQAIPGFIAIEGLFKATPMEDGGARLIYFEASNEDVDHQNEIVLQKALGDSASYYLRHGNVDISHFSLIGRKVGIENPLDYEIGTPLEVQVDGQKTFVKAELYQGDTPQAMNANRVWDSLTRQTPPMKWYPSVGGAVLSKSVRIGNDGGRVAVIDKVRWSNVALDRMPVNATVPEVSTTPLAVFAKSLNGFVVKALEAGYGTDSAALTGGGALRVQSLQGAPANYDDFKEILAKRIRKGGTHDPAQWADFAASMGIPRNQAAAWVKQFCNELRVKPS